MDLLDNDVVLKLGQYALLDDLLTMGSAESFRILPTLPYRFHLANPAKAIKVIRDAAALTRVIAFVRQVGRLDSEPPSELIELLEDTPQIDSGEVVLFAAGASDASSMTLTGDKRAIVALATAQKARPVADALRGRIKCLEQIVAEMIIRSDSVITKVRGQTWDRALRLCCASGDTAAVLAALRSYHNDLDTKCNSLLAPFPKTD